MKLTKQDVVEVLDIYIRAWVTQDDELIGTIFTDAATYHERVLEDPIRSRKGIQDYWRTKVVKSQSRITCELLNVYLDGTTAIAEWEAEFDDLEKATRKRMREIAVLVFQEKLIASLREYWVSTEIPFQ